MKKITLYIILAFFFAVSLQAQAPSNRTETTIIADVLAQMPAQNQKQFASDIQDLLSTGETGVLQLIRMLDSADKNNQAQIEYAINGMTSYASLRESDRLMLSNSYLKSLAQLKKREVKMFIIGQLGLIAKDEAVQGLSSFLNNEQLSNCAARALASINTENAGKALLDILPKTSSDAAKQPILLALGDIGYSQAEEVVRQMLNTSNSELQETVLYTLSRIGTAKSIDDVMSCARKANFQPEKTGALDASLLLTERILAQGNTKEAKKAAEEILKSAKKQNNESAREAATLLLIDVEPGRIYNYLQQGLNDKNKEYRNAVLRYASEKADPKICSIMFNSSKKSQPETKKDILNGFLQICRNSEKKDLIRSLDSNPFVNLLSDKDFEIQKSSAEVLSYIANENAIQALAGLLKSSDKQLVSLGMSNLNATLGDIATPIVSVYKDAKDFGKIAILELLAARKSSENADFVFEQLNADPSISKVAFSALKDVSSEKNLPSLYALLEKVRAEDAYPIQQAIISATKSYSAEKQFKTISDRIGKTQKNKQYLYYPVLAASASDEALGFIKERFASGNKSEKDAAFSALLNWKDRRAIGSLLAICNDSGASGYFERALDKYIQLVSSSGLSGENQRIYLEDALAIAKTKEQKNRILSSIAQTGSYLGLLLAGNYLEDKDLQQTAANAVMQIALGNKQYTGKPVKALLNKTMTVLDNPDAGYQREAIRKHLAQMSDDEGFVSIYNGKDLNGWKGLVENPIARSKMKPAELAKKQIKADEQMRKDWKVENGLLVFDGEGYDNICTEKQYADFEMLVDWKLDPAGPEPDAGIYLRGTPQVQIWDISRTNVGAQVGSGGLYNNKSNPSNPLKCIDNPLGDWNTFYIKMIGDRVTVVMNGELVVDNVILENYWDRSLPIFPKEQIELQAHGSKVYYRNVYVRELESPKIFELSAGEKKEGFKVLFDGSNMHQWVGNTVDYILEDGCISMHPTSGHGGNLYTKDEFGNFIFRFEFQLTPGANNGLGIRTPMEGDAAYVGMELQILDNEASIYKDLAEYQYHGSVYGIIPAKRGFLKPLGEWNYQEVIADGDHIKITLNGEVILDGNIREATKNGTPDKQEHPGLFNKKGHIGFLGHGSPVKFKNIRIKELKN